MMQSVNSDAGTGDMNGTPSQIPVSNDIRAISHLGTPRRLGQNNEKNELATIMAKLNTLTSQNVVHDTIFESQKLQIEEIQLHLNDQQCQLSVFQTQLSEQHTQLSVLQNQITSLQKQQDRVISLLEHLSKNIAESTLSQSQSPKDLARLSSDTLSQNIVAQAEESQNANIKLKRGRGRPRMRCSKCRQKKPIREDSTICEDCVMPEWIQSRKRHISTNEEPLVSPILPKQPRLDLSQDEASRADNSVAHEPDSHGGTAVMSSRPSSQHKGNTADTPITRVSRTNPQHAPKDRVIVVLRDSEDSRNPSIEKAPVEAQGRSRRPRSRHSDLDFSRRPFFEDSGSVHPACSDIIDPPSAEVSDSEISSVTDATSVAESISIDELMDAVTEDEEMQSSIASQYQHSHQETNRRLSQQQNQPRTPSKSHQTARTGEPKQAKQANATSSTVHASRDSMSVAPRKPIANTEPDGSKHDSHHQIVQKIMGRGWRAVNRRF